MFPGFSDKNKRRWSSIQVTVSKEYGYLKSAEYNGTDRGELLPGRRSLWKNPWFLWTVQTSTKRGASLCLSGHRNLENAFKSYCYFIASARNSRVPAFWPEMEYGPPVINILLTPFFILSLCRQGVPIKVLEQSYQNNRPLSCRQLSCSLSSMDCWWSGREVWKGWPMPVASISFVFSPVYYFLFPFPFGGVQPVISLVKASKPFVCTVGWTRCHIWRLPVTELGEQ